MHPDQCISISSQKLEGNENVIRVTNGCDYDVDIYTASCPASWGTSKVKPGKVAIFYCNQNDPNMKQFSYRWRPVK